MVYLKQKNIPVELWKSQIISQYIRGTLESVFYVL